MSSLSIDTMRAYLRRSLASNRKNPILNQNKVNGLLAEVDFRNHLAKIGFQDRVSIGGWIARSKREDTFGVKTIAMFAETMHPGKDYGPKRKLPEPPQALHSIGATFHQLGIHSYFCVPVLGENENAESVTWKSAQLGLPTAQTYNDFVANLRKIGFIKRKEPYNFLTYKTDVAKIPEEYIPEEFTKENIRIFTQNSVWAEMSDIDGILWGNQYTYPLEIKEKTSANNKDMGDYFGLDLGPFVKLAHYAARKGQMHSLFVVKEIDNTTERNLVNWWYITFERLALFASWTPQGGGRNMQGGGSTVVKIPKNQFTELKAETLAEL
jgi:hypothetical protein